MPRPSRMLWMLMCFSGCAFGTISRSTDTSEQEDFFLDLVTVWDKCLLSTNITDENVLCDTESLQNRWTCFDREKPVRSKTFGETPDKVFGILRESTKMVIDRLCTNGSKVLFSLLREYQLLQEKWRTSLVEKSKFTVDYMLAGLISPTTFTSHISLTPSSRLWFFYNYLHNLKHFFEENFSLRMNLVETRIQELKAMLENLKCLHPVDDRVMLCKEINTTLVGYLNLCAFKRTDQVQSIDNAIAQKALQCFYGVSDVNRLYSSRNLQRLREFFKDYCIPKQCTIALDVLATACLSKSSVHDVHTLVSYLKTTKEQICKREGKNLAKIFNRYYYAGNKGTNSSRDLLECVGGNILDTPYTLDILDYLQGFPNIGQCFLNKLTIDDRYQSAVKDIYNDILSRTECF